MFLTYFYAGLFYLATIVFLAGVGYAIVQYARAPAPLKIPTMPAPLTRSGAGLRILGEVVLFRSLFRSNKWIWLLGWVFHISLVLVLIRHLRYFIDPVWFWVVLIQPFGKYAGFAMVAGLAGLLIRRIIVERIKFISGPSDYLMLILLLGVGASGLLMNFVMRTDIVQLKAFILGIMVFDYHMVPADPVLILHLSSVVLLMLVFPFSKLLHAPGVFFSPSRNQADDAREKRHLAPWAAKLETPP
ncbi:MAG: nitrate reductase [Gammaproteobacteria bacterium]|nr:nitrate reductase [Gammaproteobacteria bacterium]